MVGACEEDRKTASTGVRAGKNVTARRESTTKRFFVHDISVFSPNIILRSIRTNNNTDFVTNRVFVVPI